MRLEGRFVGVEEDEVAELLDEARAELGLTAAARERFRMNVLRRFYEDYGVAARRPGLPQLRRGRARAAAGRAADALPRRVAGRRPKPEQVVRRLLASATAARRPGCSTRTSSGSCAARAAAGATPTCRCSTRPARCCVEPPTRYGHVIVDEAQDLTPMQLRMVARRASRLVHAARRHRAGDRPDRLRPLGGAAPVPAGGDSAEVEELRHAYRVPREIMAARAAAARADRARGRAADRLPRRRRASARRGGPTRRCRRPSKRPPGSRATTACSR